MWVHLSSHQVDPRGPLRANLSYQGSQDLWGRSDVHWAVLQTSGDLTILAAASFHPTPLLLPSLHSCGRGTAGVLQLPWPKMVPLLHPFLSSHILLKWAEARPMQNLPWRHFVGADDQQGEGRMFHCLSSLPSSGFWQKGLVFLLLFSPAEGVYSRSAYSEAVWSYCNVTLECKRVTSEAGVSKTRFPY